MRQMVFSALTLTALAAGAMAATPATLRGHQFGGEARVSLSRARMIALKARPGIVADQQLDKESGGSGLRYSFDIFSAGKMSRSGSMPRPARCWRTALKAPRKGKRRANRG